MISQEKFPRKSLNLKKIIDFTVLHNTGMNPLRKMFSIYPGESSSSKPHYLQERTARPLKPFRSLDLH